MTLAKTLDSLDGLADPIKAEYKKNDDGKYVLDVEGGFEDVDGLKSALAKERKNAKDLDKALTGFKKLGDTPEEIQAKMDALEEESDKDGKGVKGVKVKETREYIMLEQQLEAAKKEAGTANDKAGNISKAAQSVIRENALQAALVENNATPSGMKLLTQNLANRIQVEIGDDAKVTTTVVQEDGETPMIGSGADGAATVADLVKEVGVKSFPELFNGKGTGGSGKPPGAGGAGGEDGKTITRSEYDALAKSDPGAAAALFSKGDMTVVEDG